MARYGKLQWFSVNKLAVNLDLKAETNSIQIENAIVKKVPSTKYLGVILDENLDRKEHISNINKSLIKTSNSFKIIKHQFPQLDKIIFYYAYIYSKKQYGIDVYGGQALQHLEKFKKS